MPQYLRYSARRSGSWLRSAVGLLRRLKSDRRPLLSKSTPDSFRVKSLFKQVKRPPVSARADAGYDAKRVYRAVEHHCPGSSPRVLITPWKGAVVARASATTRQRNRNIRVRSRVGKQAWDVQPGYSQRSNVETPFSRYKAINGPKMRARRLSSQRVEVRVGCHILNVMTGLGMPDGIMSQPIITARVGHSTPGSRVVKQGNQTGRPRSRRTVDELSPSDFFSYTVEGRGGDPGGVHQTSDYVSVK